MISVSDVNLTFDTNDGPVNALKNVSMEVNEGDFVSFIGPSGCCLLYTSPSPRDTEVSRMPSSA